MKIYCITDNTELEVGLKLAGCDGTTLNKQTEIEDKLNEVLKNKEIGILLLTKNIYEQSKNKVDYIRKNNKLPLITIL